jgi:hypothetical protein
MVSWTSDYSVHLPIDLLNQHMTPVRVFVKSAAENTKKHERPVADDKFNITPSACGAPAHYGLGQIECR